MSEKIPRMETINRAAELTGLSYSVIYNLCKENRIVYIKTGRKYLINMDKLTVFLNRGEEECPGGVNITYV
nr:MAG TPA: helix-turn-helix domain protein [Bacteriophage sp.]